MKTLSCPFFPDEFNCLNFVIVVSPAEVSQLCSESFSSIFWSGFLVLRCAGWRQELAVGLARALLPPMPRAAVHRRGRTPLNQPGVNYTLGEGESSAEPAFSCQFHDLCRIVLCVCVPVNSQRFGNHKEWWRGWRWKDGACSGPAGAAGTGQEPGAQGRARSPSRPGRGSSRGAAGHGSGTLG